MRRDRRRCAGAADLYESPYAPPRDSTRPGSRRRCALLFDYRASSSQRQEAPERFVKYLEVRRRINFGSARQRLRPRRGLPSRRACASRRRALSRGCRNCEASRKKEGLMSARGREVEGSARRSPVRAKRSAAGHRSTGTFAHVAVHEQLAPPCWQPPRHASQDRLPRARQRHDHGARAASQNVRPAARRAATAVSQLHRDRGGVDVPASASRPPSSPLRFCRQ